MYKFNKQFQNTFTNFRSLHGATLKHVKYYVVPSLIEKNPNKIVFHGRYNDLNNKNLTPKMIAIDIRNMAQLSCGYNLIETFILR